MKKNEELENKIDRQEAFEKKLHIDIWDHSHKKRKDGLECLDRV